MTCFVQVCKEHLTSSTLPPADDVPEVMDRVVKLLEQQRLQQQALLAHLQDQRLQSDFANQVLKSVLNSHGEAQCMQLLEQATPASVMDIRDANGMTVLHHAIRQGKELVFDRVLEINPNLADQITNCDGRPAHWSTLMLLVDTKIRALGEEKYFYFLRRLLQTCSCQTMQARSTNGSTVLHAAGSKGLFQVLKLLLWGLYDKAGATERAFGLVRSLVNSPGGPRNAGVVDARLSCNVELAMYLKRYWGGVELLDAPVWVWDQGYRRRVDP